MRQQILLAQSYAKNFGLYGQRVGALNVVTANADETRVVLSNLNKVLFQSFCAIS